MLTMKPTPNEADTDVMTDEIRKIPRVIESSRRPWETAAAFYRYGRHFQRTGCKTV